MAGLYIHIPLCTQRCSYCDFFSTTLLSKRGELIDALCKEMAIRKDYLPVDANVLETIYIGGGTPSLLTSDEINILINHALSVFPHIDVEKMEITMEANPNDLTDDYLKHLSNTPINRLSIGIQSFVDDELKIINRRHTSNEAMEAVTNARKHGFRNISIDLIYGLPMQTIESWNYSVDTAISLSPNHISAYCLELHEGSLLTKKLEKGEIDVMDENDCLDCFKILHDRTKEAGFEHYEISNFALPKLRAKHNSGYWHGMLYLGCGPGAHSYNGNSRQWNNQNVMQYIECNGNVTEAQLFEVEELTPEMKYNELLLTSLRTSDGLDLSLLKENQKRDLLNMAKTFIENSTLRIVNNHLCLTRKGVFISDGIISNLMV